ncbi:putative TetR family transcriptional regulator [Roseibium sp. TrichSKD4]|nr:putative TetR family transcriptional regulator [Roseibium sp. TrichSKD4]
MAERHGFVPREPIKKIVRRKEAEPSANLNIRPPVSVYNRFVAWAIENRMSYPEALKELMDRANI